MRVRKIGIKIWEKLVATILFQFISCFSYHLKLTVIVLFGMLIIVNINIIQLTIDLPQPVISSLVRTN